MVQKVFEWMTETAYFSVRWKTRKNYFRLPHQTQQLKPMSKVKQKQS